MDVQMPEMDGLEASRTIRAAERKGGRRLPIVALTANALGGDRERCLEAGMDDYLSKPIRKQELVDVLARWSPHPTVAVLEERGTASSDPVFDRDDALARMSGDHLLLREISEMVLTDTEQQLTALDAAEVKGDFAKVRTVAHGLKGAIAGIGGVELSKVLAELEGAARDGSGERVALLKRRTRNAWRALQSELKTWLEQT